MSLIPVPSSLTRRSGALVLVVAGTALCGFARAQGGNPAPKPAPTTNEQLDAEREKLRLKDVEGWKKLQIKSLDQVVDIKKITQPIEMPPMTDQEKTRIAELLQQAKDGGGAAKTGRALHALEKMGYPALVAIVNQLREIDYKDTDQAMFGMQLNASLQTMTLGINTGYVAIEPGEAMDPRKAQFNAMTVPEWQRGVKQFWPNKEKFDEYIKNRKAKKDAELEGDKPDDKGKSGGDPKKGDDKKGGK
jgi:hypothetical protein